MPRQELKARPRILWTLAILALPIAYLAVSFDFLTSAEALNAPVIEVKNPHTDSFGQVRMADGWRYSLFVAERDGVHFRCPQADKYLEEIQHLYGPELKQKKIPQPTKARAFVQYKGKTLCLVPSSPPEVRFVSLSI